MAKDKGELNTQNLNTFLLNIPVNVLALVAKGKAVAKAKAKNGEGSDGGSPVQRKQKTPKSRPEPTRKSARQAQLSEPEGTTDDDIMDLDDDVFVSKSQPLLTTKSRPKPKPRYAHKSPTPEEPEQSEDAGTPTPDPSSRATSSTPLSPPPSPNKKSIPKKVAGTKRPAPDFDEEQNVTSSQGSPPKVRQPSPAASEASLGDYQSARKRARR